METEPRYLGHYQMQECIARGGMGEVWKALDTRLQRTVAIKLLLANWRHSTDFVSRFQSEARLIASLRHPNIVNIHNFHVEEQPNEPPFLYMVMDYVEGQTMASYIAATSKQGQFPAAEDIIYLFTAISLALDYAHGRGMIHRDIKPANILLDQRNTKSRSMGEPIITDFGIARRQGVSGGTQIGTIVGTPLYVAPEQALGNYEEKSSDLYSLGIILYEMMTGTPPFRGENMLSVVMQHVNQPPLPPELLNDQISPAVSAVILKSIAKQPDERYASACEMTVALAEAFQVAIPASLLQGVHRAPAETVRSLSYQPASQPGRPISQPGNLILSPATLAASPSPYVAPVEPVAEPETPPLPRPRLQHKRRWLIISAISLLVVIGLIASGSLFLSTRPTVQPQGTIHFSRGPAAKYYNILQIDAENIPDPPTGKVYYAWVDNVSDEQNLAHWKLEVKNQQIHSGVLTGSASVNLLAPQNLFLITLEDASNSHLLVPEMDPKLRLYYARIPAKDAPLVYNMHMCAGDANPTACF
ncbi:hypothetical protein KDA_12010 [Dictyobacter alpinus]|uniref:non-specific serine/threonine protein kinase n=1 Tax=Dictyobacter alpinus TaxID=2014873 RepID=A0A402B330_9CHLR|nr:serine/threonine-protein kinase [Dictyobacter alpinus]GCE25717.1 hypothetical protein KDA_12010 [Dictyobacter alpinus]